MGTNNLTGLNIEFPIYNSDGSSFYGLVLRRATFDSVVMSLGDKITGDVVYINNALPVSMGEYIVFAGVKYTLVNPPTVVREGLAQDNSDLKGMTKYSFEFYHPMYQLGNLPFSDVAVSLDQQRYLSENKVFSWIGKPDDYIAKLNKNLANTQWIVVKSDEFPVEKINVLSDVLSFDKATIADALKTWYDTWKIPYVVDAIDESDPLYAQGKRFKVVMGLPSNEILDSDDNPYIFEMGQGVGLKNNSRTPKNNKIVTRIAPYGSERNIPYGYPQIVWTGNQDWDYTIDNDPTAANSYPIYDGIVGGQNVRLIKHPFTRKTLMPSIYATLVNKKVNPNATGYDPTIELVDYYDATSEEHYPNPINPLAPSYEAHEFSDIYPRLDEKSILSAEPYDTLEEQGVDGYVQETEFLGTVLNNSTSTTNSQERTALLGLYNALNSGSATYHAESQSGDDYQFVCDVTSDDDFYYVKYTSSNINYDVVLLKTGHTVPVASSWNDKMDDEGNYVQSYFKITLPLLNFDMYACASITEEMKIYMRSGACIGCTFNVAVDWDDYKKNFYDENGNFAPNGSQRDLTKYPKTNSESVTLIVQKDNETFGTLMPNIYQQPTTGDEFVVLGISLPTSYIADAEQELDDAAKQYMLENNVYYYEYPLKFDEHFLAKNTDILEQIKPNSIVRFKYNGEQDNIVLYVKQMTVKYGQGVLPQYDITVTDDIEVVLNKIGQVTDDVSRMRFDIARLMQLYTEGVNIDAINRLISEKLSKIEDDTAQGFISFMQGIQVGERFVSGILGEGGVFRRNADGKVYLETDNLYVRMKAYFDTVEVRHYKHSTGNRIASNAGIHCSRVVWIDASGNQTEDIDSAVKFRCYFRATDGEDTVANYFVAASNGTQDLAFCDKTTVESGVNNRRYWRAVVGKNAVLTDDGEAWIDLSKSDCESGSDIPMAGDDIIQLGNKTDTERQGAIIEYVNGNDAPSYHIYQFINSYSLENKNIIRIGFNSSTGRAEMNVYGDAYIGDPNGSTYVKYNQATKKLEIKAEVSLQSTFGGQSLEQYIQGHTWTQQQIEALFTDDFNDIDTAIDNIQKQVDGAIETWFYNGVPSSNVLPESEWKAKDIAAGNNNERLKHLGDLYYDNQSGYAYRYTNQGTESVPQFVWTQISDSAVIKALADAAKAQYTADHKMKVFVRQPLDSEDYQVGDMWVNATYSSEGYENDVLRCNTAKAKNVAFSISHWEKASKYTDDSALTTFLAGYQGTAQQLKNQIDQKAETWYQQTNPVTTTQGWVSSEHIGDLWYNTTNQKTYYYDGVTTTDTYVGWKQQNVPIEVFNKIDGKSSIFISQPSNYKANDLWILAEQTTVNGVTYKQGEILTATADSKTYNQGHWVKKVNYTNDDRFEAFVTQILNGTATTGNDQTVAAALYAIKTALNGGVTTVNGGLILTNLIYLRDANNNVKSGISGAYNSNATGGGIAAWYGGEPIDHEVDAIASNYAKSLFRFDGSGYLAGGNITWDKNGNASIKGELDARISGVGGWLIAPRINSSLGVPAIEGYNNSNTLVFSLQFDGDENGGTSLHDGGGLYMYDRYGLPISRYTRSSWQINYEDTSSNIWSYMVASVNDDEANIRGFYQFNQQSEQKQYYFDIGVDSKGIILQAQKWPALNELIEPDDWHRVFVDGYGLVRVKGVNDSFVPQGSSQAIVTSVGLSAPTGFQVSNSPITTSGTIALSFASGYSLPTTAKQANWDTAYGWGNHANAGYLTQQGNSFYFITDADMPETAANISTLNAAHRMTLYRNAILMPYQTDNANDGGFIRSRGASESSAIMEIGMWDDAGAGETIQFNYYPTTSTINPTYSISVPKKTGTIALTSDLSGYATTSQLADYLPLTGGTLTGDLYLTNGKKINIILIEGRRIVSLNLGYSQINDTEYAWNMYVGSALDVSAGLDMDGVFVGSGFKKIDGTSSQFLKADGSVDSNAYITLASVKGNLSAWNNTAMTWGTLTAANGYTIGVHASSSDGGDWGMAYKGGQIFMQLDGYYYQNEGAYRVVDTSDLASYNPTTNFKTINNQSIIGTGNINIEGGGGGAYYDAEIEYLGISGCHVELPFYPSTNYKYYWKVSFNTIENWNYLFNSDGSRGDWFIFGGTETNRQPQLHIGNNYSVSTVSLQTNTLYECSLTRQSNSMVLKYNNTTTNTVVCSDFTSSKKLHINGPNCNFYYLKVYDGNDNLIYDFIPVRVGNVGYLYDKVSGELFGNSGTGSFVLGQDTGPGGGLPYLPLTGGTISGNLTVNGAVKFNNNLTFANDRGIYFGTGKSVRIMRDSSRLLIVNEAGGDIIIGDYDDRNYTSIVNDLAGWESNSAYILGTQTWYIFNDGTAQFKTVSQTSDLNKKNIMGDVPINLYNVANAPLFKFTWKDEKKYSGQHIGSAAQYWQTVLPELVSIGRDTEQTLAIQYDVIALASAITVAKTVVNHEERIKILENENKSLKEEIELLKNKS